MNYINNTNEKVNDVHANHDDTAEGVMGLMQLSNARTAHFESSSSIPQTTPPTPAFIMNQTWNRTMLTYKNPQQSIVEDKDTLLNITVGQEHKQEVEG